MTTSLSDIKIQELSLSLSQYITIVIFIIVIMVANVFTVVVYVLACRLARTDCKNGQMPKISILEY